MIGSLFKGLAKGLFSKGIVNGAMTGGAMYAAGSFIDRYAEGNYTSGGARAGASLLAGGLKLYGGARMATGAFSTGRRAVGSFMKSGIQELRGTAGSGFKMSEGSASLYRSLTRGARTGRGGKLVTSSPVPNLSAGAKGVADTAAQLFVAKRAAVAGGSASASGGSSLASKVWGAAHYPISGPVKSLAGWGNAMWQMGKGGPDGYMNMGRALSDMSNPFIGPALIGAGYGMLRASYDSQGNKEVAPHYSSRGSSAGVNQNMFPRGISHYGNGVSSPVVFASQQVLTKRMMGSR